jgi:hypothetical protein
MRPIKLTEPIAMTITLRLTQKETVMLDYLIADRAAQDMAAAKPDEKGKVSVSLGRHMTRPDFLKYIITKAYNNRVK